MSLDVRGLAPLLQVFDMPTSIAFYRDVLGFEVIGTSRPGPPFDWALLKLNNVELMLNTAYEAPTPVRRPPIPRASPATPIPASTSAAPTSTRPIPTSAPRASTWKKPVVQHYGMKQLYVRDPDGYMLCFQWPATPPEGSGPK